MEFYKLHKKERYDSQRKSDRPAFTQKWSTVHTTERRVMKYRSKFERQCQASLRVWANANGMESTARNSFATSLLPRRSWLQVTSLRMNRKTRHVTEKAPVWHKSSSQGRFPRNGRQTATPSKAFRRKWAKRNSKWRAPRIEWQLLNRRQKRTHQVDMSAMVLPKRHLARHLNDWRRHRLRRPSRHLVRDVEGRDPEGTKSASCASTHAAKNNRTTQHLKPLRIWNDRHTKIVMAMSGTWKRPYQLKI